MTTTITAPPTPEDVSAQVDLDRECAALVEAARRPFDTFAERQANVASLIAKAAGRNTLTGDPHYTTDDVLGWVERALEKGCACPRMRPTEVEDVFRMKRVPNAKLRAEYERQVEEGVQHLPMRLARAAKLGRSERPDTTGVLRFLGIESVPGDKGAPPSLRTFISYEVAVAFADALGMDYHDLGL